MSNLWIKYKENRNFYSSMGLSEKTRFIRIMPFSVFGKNLFFHIFYDLHHEILLFVWQQNKVFEKFSLSGRDRKKFSIFLCKKLWKTDIEWITDCLQGIDGRCGMAFPHIGNCGLRKPGYLCQLIIWQILFFHDFINFFQYVHMNFSL